MSLYSTPLSSLSISLKTTWVTDHKRYTYRDGLKQGLENLDKIEVYIQIKADMNDSWNCDETSPQDIARQLRDRKAFLKRYLKILDKLILWNTKPSRSHTRITVTRLTSYNITLASSRWMRDLYVTSYPRAYYAEKYKESLMGQYAWYFK